MTQAERCDATDAKRKFLKQYSPVFRDQPSDVEREAFWQDGFEEGVKVSLGGVWPLVKCLRTAIEELKALLRLLERDEEGQCRYCYAHAGHTSECTYEQTLKRVEKALG